jgi:hypothetical protein
MVFWARDSKLKSWSIDGGHHSLQVAGYFYCTAYSTDRLLITTYLAGSASVLTESRQEETVASEDGSLGDGTLGYVSFSPDQKVLGYNPLEAEKTTSLGRNNIGIHVPRITWEYSNSRQVILVACEVSRPGRLALYICDIAGRRIRTLLDEEREGGTVNVPWDLRSDAGIRVASGIYFVRATSGNASGVARVLVVR